MSTNKQNIFTIDPKAKIEANANREGKADNEFQDATDPTVPTDSTENTALQVKAVQPANGAKNVAANGALHPTNAENIPGSNVESKLEGDELKGDENFKEFVRNIKLAIPTGWNWVEVNNFGSSQEALEAYSNVMSTIGQFPDWLEKQYAKALIALASESQTKLFSNLIIRYIEKYDEKKLVKMIKSMGIQFATKHSDCLFFAAARLQLPLLAELLIKSYKIKPVMLCGKSKTPIMNALMSFGGFVSDKAAWEKTFSILVRNGANVFHVDRFVRVYKDKKHKIEQSCIANGLLSFSNFMWSTLSNRTSSLEYLLLPLLSHGAGLIKKDIRYDSLYEKPLKYVMRTFDQETMKSMSVDDLCYLFSNATILLKVDIVTKFSDPDIVVRLDSGTHWISTLKALKAFLSEHFDFSSKEQRECINYICTAMAALEGDDIECIESGVYRAIISFTSDRLERQEILLNEEPSNCQYLNIGYDYYCRNVIQPLKELVASYVDDEELPKLPKVTNSPSKR